MPQLRTWPASCSLPSFSPIPSSGAIAYILRGTLYGGECLSKMISSMNLNCFCLPGIPTDAMHTSLLFSVGHEFSHSPVSKAPSSYVSYEEFPGDSMVSLHSHCRHSYVSYEDHRCLQPVADQSRPVVDIGANMCHTKTCPDHPVVVRQAAFFRCRILSPTNRRLRRRSASGGAPTRARPPGE